MKAIIASIIVTVVGVITVPQLAGATSPQTTFAQGIYKGCNGVSAQNSKLCGEKNSASINKLITSIVNVLLMIVGVVAVIMIIIGGIKYVTSAGDAAATSAKNTILYAVVGLVIAAFAYAIVNFVVGRL